MRHLSKILIAFFLAIFISQLAGLLFLAIAPSAGQAADLKFKPQVGLPVQRQDGDTFDFSGKTENTFPKDGSTAPIAQYIRAIYKYAIGIVGILAAVVLMIGGVLWIVAGGSATMIGEAKSWIGASLTGLTIALLSYLILATVNPALVDLKTTVIKNVNPAPTAKQFDQTTDCGIQVPGQDVICGSKCLLAGQTCKNVNKAMQPARECPITVGGNGNYYRCDDHCKDNQDADYCPANYICNMHKDTGQPSNNKGEGICTVKQASGGKCDENPDCQSNKCALSSVYRTWRCQ